MYKTPSCYDSLMYKICISENITMIRYVCIAVLWLIQILYTVSVIAQCVNGLDLNMSNTIKRFPVTKYFGTEVY